MDPRSTNILEPENPKLQELRLCRREQADVDHKILMLQGQIGAIESNKAYSSTREKTMTMNLDQLMRKVNAEGYHNRHLYSVEENDFKRDLAQAKAEILQYESQIYPLNRECNELKRKKKLLKKKEKRIQKEMNAGIKLSTESEDGLDNPIAGPMTWLMNILGTNAFPKAIGLGISLAMILYVLLN